MFHIVAYTLTAQEYYLKSSTTPNKVLFTEKPKRAVLYKTVEDAESDIQILLDRHYDELKLYIKQFEIKGLLKKNRNDKERRVYRVERQVA